jgi:hypothetical protein
MPAREPREKNPNPADTAETTDHHARDHQETATAPLLPAGISVATATASVATATAAMKQQQLDHTVAQQQQQQQQ